MSLAELDDISIISADSRQIYRGFDIGTAKPTRDERDRVPHYGIDVAEPDERYSASAWADAAIEWMADARSLGRTPVVVGGTGFYMRALVEPLFAEPDLDADARGRLADFLESFTIAELRRWCLQLDPDRARLGRTQLLRAIEIAVLTGKRVSELHVTASRAGRVTARYLLVDPGPPLAGRIEARVRQMVNAGWLEEAKALAARVPASAPAWNATGYRDLHRWIRGECTADEAIARIVIATRQYAKRQRTWFRHQLPAAGVQTVNPDDPNAGAIVKSWWAARERAA